MKPMSSLNGYEIVDAKARSDIKKILDEGRNNGPQLLYLDGEKIYQRGADLASDTRTLLVNGKVTTSNYVRFDGSQAGVAAGELIGRWVEIAGKKAYVGANSSDLMTLYYDETKSLVRPITCEDNTVIYPADTDVTKEIKKLIGDKEAVAIDLSALETDGVIVETYTDGTKKTTTLEFDGDGNPVKITDSDGNETILTW